MHKIFLNRYKITTQSICQKSDILLIKKMKKSCQLWGFAIPVDLRGKIKESKKINKYLDFERVSKTL